MLRYRTAKKHLSDSEMRRYRERAMEADELVPASDHLLSCPECSERSSGPDLKGVYSFVRSSLETSPDDHLLFEQLAGYSDNALDAHEREAVERHLVACEECEADVDGFLDLSALMSTREEGSRFSTVRSVSPLPTLKERLSAFWQAATYRSLLAALNQRPIIQMTAVILIVSLVIWGVTRSTQRRINDLTLEIKQLQGENNSMREAASNADAQIASLIKQNEGVRREDGNPLQMAVRLNDGIGRVAFDETGSVQGLEALPVELRNTVQTALQNGRLQIAAAPAVKIGRVGTLLGPGDAETFKLITPVNSVVLSNLPAFRWEALPGATGYTVLVRDIHTGREIESEQLSDTQWTPKEALARGHTYAWMVEAIKDGRRLRAPALNLPYAGFKVLDQQLLENIQRAQTSWGHSHLVMGVVYAKAGLKDAARKELKEVQAANLDAVVVNKLIRSLDSRK